jgi:hypothetical protein
MYFCISHEEYKGNPKKPRVCNERHIWRSAVRRYVSDGATEQSRDAPRDNAC